MKIREGWGIRKMGSLKKISFWFQHTCSTRIQLVRVILSTNMTDSKRSQALGEAFQNIAKNSCMLSSDHCSPA